MRPQVRTIRTGLIVAFAGLLAGFATNPCRADVLVNDKFPFALTAVVVCDGVLEDIVAVEGTLHVKINLTVDANGGFHYNAHFQPQGADGIGLLTGDEYNAVGITRDGINAKSDNLVFKFINNFHMVGQGGGINFNIRERVTVVIVDGVVKVDHEVLEVTCH